MGKLIACPCSHWTDTDVENDAGRRNPTLQGDLRFWRTAPCRDSSDMQCFQNFPNPLAITLQTLREQKNSRGGRRVRGEGKV
jgi:hypothetical protein